MEGILESKEQYRKIVKAWIAQWLKDLQSENKKDADCKGFGTSHRVGYQASAG